MKRTSESSRLPWRALFSDPPTAWQRLSLLTRGVGDELLRVIDRDGEIDCGREDPVAVVCRITGAHPRERRRVGEAVHELLEERFLVLVEVDGEKRIRTELPDVAMARSEFDRKRGKATRSEPEPDAKRTRSEPEASPNPTRSDPEPNVKATRSAPEVGPKCAESLAPTPVEVEGEGERELEGEGEEKGAAAEPQPRPSDEERIEELSTRYPRDLLAEVHAACRAHRKTGRMAASAWRAALERLAVFELDVVVRAMRTFVDRYGDGSKGEDYLVGIARGERDRRPAAQQRLEAIATARMPPPARQSDLEDGMGTWDLTEARPS